MQRLRLAIFILPCLALPWAVSPISSNGQEPTRTAGAAVSAPQVPPAADKPVAKRKTIAMLVYPGFTALDLVGPHQVFSVLQGYQVQLVWKTKELVSSDRGLTVQPTMTLKECPEE